MKKAILMNYVELLANSKYCEDGTVTLDEFLVWITQKGKEFSRKNWLIKPWKSFIVILSLIQFITGVADRIEKYYLCNDYIYQEQGLCPYIRPFHDAMLFKACLRFEAWRYITHILISHAFPNLATNLGLQLFFGKYLISNNL